MLFQSILVESQYAAALSGLNPVNWGAMLFTVTGLIEGWLRSSFVIIGQVRVVT
jgi:hypothetical protein